VIDAFPRMGMGLMNTSDSANGKPELEDEKDDSTRELNVLMRLIGYSAYLAWLISMLLTPIFSPYILYTESDATICRVAFLGGVIACLLVFWRLYRWKQLKRCIVLASLVCPVAILLVIANFLGLSLSIRVVLWLVLGCLAVPMMSLWSTVYANLDYDRAALFLSVAFCVSFVWVLLAALMQYGSIVVGVCLPLISVILYIKTDNIDDYIQIVSKRDLSSTSRDFRISWRLDCGIAAYSVCLGFALFVGSLSAYWPITIIAPLIAACCGGGLCILDARKKRSITLTQMHKVFLLVVLTVTLPLIFFNEIALIVVCVIASFCFIFNLIVNLSGQVIGMVVYGAPPVRYACRAKIPNMVAMAVGYVCAYLYHQTIYASDQTHLVAQIIIVVVILLFGTISIFGLSSTFPMMESELSEEASEQLAVFSNRRHDWASRCEQLADLYEFSPRQRDVLKYLSRGRNVPYISETLFISESTVKSHVYSMYRKSDVHSVQELIDKIEALGSGPDANS
jgi:DNA-binding CsgD family transcriptional regulator